MAKPGWVTSMSVGQLAQISISKQPTVARSLDCMEAKGYVERLANECDRRITPVRITAAGSRKVLRFISLAREHEHRVLQPFGLKRAEELKSILRDIVETDQATNAS